MIDLDSIDDSQPLPPCDSEVFNEGVSVFMTHTIPCRHVDAWVKEVAKSSGQKVDWHYSGGRANILALGSIDKVRDGILEQIPLLMEIWKRSFYFEEMFRGTPDGFEIQIGSGCIGSVTMTKDGKSNV